MFHLYQKIFCSCILWYSYYLGWVNIFHVILNYYLIKCFICLLWYDLIIQQFSNLGLPWSWSYGDWIYNYLCNQCLSPLTLLFWIPLSWYVLDTTLCDKVCQWFAAGLWFSPSIPVLPPRYNWNIVEPYPPQICQHSFLLYLLLNKWLDIPAFHSFFALHLLLIVMLAHLI